MLGGVTMGLERFDTPEPFALPDGALASYRRTGVMILEGFWSPERSAAVIQRAEYLARTADRPDHAAAFSTRSCAHAGDAYFRESGDKIRAFLEEGRDWPSGGAAPPVNKIGQALQLPYALGANVSQAGASIGIRLFGSEAVSAAPVLKQADLAMYEAKASGRHAIRFFEMSLQRAYQRRTDLDGALQRAVAERRFILVYQPQFSGRGRLIGAEALLRWSGEDGRLIPPSAFIPHAEESGLILQIGDWVLETACRRLQHWQAMGIASDIRLAVNISARQFKQRDFVTRVREVVERMNVDPQRLRFEITESVLLDDMGAAIERMRELRDLGVAFSIDDFGTGYSSLAYLRELPVDELKIDQRFVRDFTRDAGGEAIVRGIIAMAKALRLKVLAEGVETRAEFDALAGAGCDSYQGFLFSRPVAGTQALFDSASAFRRHEGEALVL